MFISGKTPHLPNPNPRNKGTWPKLKGNKGTEGNRGQIKCSLSINLTVNLKNNPTKLQGTREFSQGNRGAYNAPKQLSIAVTVSSNGSVF